MTNQKTNKIKLKTFILFIIALNILLCVGADPTINDVYLTTPLAEGLLQTVSANITTSGLITTVNIEINSINYTMNLNEGLYHYSYIPSKGTIDYKIHAMNSEGNTTTYLSSFEVKDLTPPTLLIVLPSDSILTSDSFTIKITTDEDSICKFDTSNVSYNLMSNFFTTSGKKIHESILTHITAGDKKYYYSCMDESGNIGLNQSAFKVNLGPTAQISLSKTSPLKADTYKISLLTSKHLSSAPILTYKYDDEQKNYQVSMIGQDSNWEGYLVIPLESKDRIGTFSFQGTDYDGISGNKISNGAMFIVDTTKPIAPISVSSIINDNKIELTWFYDGEQAQKYNIYRSNVPGVEYVDYYDYDKDFQYFDSSVENAEDYYYRIAVVDKAGNVGELSEEVHLKFEKKEKAETSKVEVVLKENVLSPYLEKKINTTIAEVKTLKFDTKYSISQLEKQSDRYKATVIKELKLIEKIKTSEAQIESILNELENIKSQDLSEKDFNDKLENINKKIIAIKEENIIDVKISDSLEYTQIPNEFEINNAVNEIYLRKDLDKNTKTNYTRIANSIQDSSNIFQTIIVGKLISYNEKETSFSLVIKEVSVTDSEYNVIVLESIPKKFAENSKKIIFSENPSILKEDTMIYFSQPKLENIKFSYYIYEDRSINDAKDAVTIILPDSSKYIQKKGVYNPDEDNSNINPNPITGKFILKTEKLKGVKDYIFLILGGMILSGLVVYYFFFMNENKLESFEEQKTISNLQNISNQKYFGVDNIHCKKPDEKHLLNLIDHAELHANNLNFDQAIKEYTLIHSFFINTPFDHSFKSEAAKKITNLHNKIIVKKKVELANETVLKGDMVLLGKIVSDLESSKNSFSKSEKHALKEYVNDYHSYYLSILSLIDKK